MTEAELLQTACCGIDCTNCGIRKAAIDPAEAEREAARWRSRGHADAKPEWFQCQGCHGPTEVVWSGKCKIRACARKRSLTNCSQCEDFPCANITAFESDGNAHHRKAIERLRAMAGKEQGE
jgi:hypothetical protein